MAGSESMLTGASVPHEKGPHEVANAVYVHLQPAGGWRWSNASLFATDDGSLLVDTLNRSIPGLFGAIAALSTDRGLV